MDTFGGTIGAAAEKERDYHNIGLLSNVSSAMMDKSAQNRKDALNLEAAAKQVDALNKKE